MGSEQSSIDTSPSGGFRVFKVSPGSPAMEAGLYPFFDVIVKMNDLELVQITFFFEKFQYISIL